MEQLVYIVDDDVAVRDSLRMMLQAAGYQVRTFSQARQFLADAELDRGCLIADIRMPEMSGLELQEELVRRKADIPVIIITGHGDIPLAVRAMSAGAIDFIEKPFERERILGSIEKAMQVGAKNQSRGAEIRAALDLLEQLTPREKSVLEELVKGHANKVIAKVLDISPRTVEIHRAHIMSKLHARSLSDIVRTSLAAAS
ncbi:MAG TPA: response regulator, partial [Rhizomicrobium sp.]|nr:response regulator [Rhizomicrobium sp.]